MADLQRQIDEKEKQNVVDRQKFSDKTAAEERRHQSEIGDLNKHLQEKITRFNSDYEQLRKSKEAEI